MTRRRRGPRACRAGRFARMHAGRCLCCGRALFDPPLRPRAREPWRGSAFVRIRCRRPRLDALRAAQMLRDVAGRQCLGQSSEPAEREKRKRKNGKESYGFSHARPATADICGGRQLASNSQVTALAPSTSTPGALLSLFRALLSGPCRDPPLRNERHCLGHECIQKANDAVLSSGWLRGLHLALVMDARRIHDGTRVARCSLAHPLPVVKEQYWSA